MSAKPLAFISYCHTERKLCDALVAALKPYRMQGHFDFWYDKDLQASDVHKPQILQNLEQADFAILLVSQAFAASPFIQNEELPRILKAQREGRMRVFWLLADPADLGLLEDLMAIQAVENPTAPLSAMEDHQQKQIYVSLGIQLRKLSKELAAAAAPPAPPAEVPVSVGELQAPISLSRGGLTTRPADALVYSASATWSATGGMSAAVQRDAGPELAQLLSRTPPLELTQAIATPGFQLPARTLVHALGPRWYGQQQDADLLEQTYLNGLRLAVAEGARTIVIGPFGVGAKGFPLADAARVALSAARQVVAENRAPLSIDFVLARDDVHAAFEQALNEPQGLAPSLR